MDMDEYKDTVTRWHLHNLSRKVTLSWDVVVNQCLPGALKAKRIPSGQPERYLIYGNSEAGEVPEGKLGLHLARWCPNYLAGIEDASSVNWDHALKYIWYELLKRFGVSATEA